MSDEVDVQAERDRAMRTLQEARQDKNDTSCLGTIGAGMSCMGALAGLGFISCGGHDTTIGTVIATVCGLGFVQRARSYAARPPSQDEAEARIVAVAGRLEGVESLRLSEPLRKALHHVVYDAQAPLAIAILRILAVAGDANSLRVAQNIRHDFQLSNVLRSEAESAAKQIDRRLEVARRRRTLLRPAGLSQSDELLRAISTADRDDHDILLRADTPGDKGAETDA